MKRFALLTALFLVPGLLQARTYDAQSLRYTDVTSDTNGAVAISTLTEAGVLQGNPDGTYRPYRFLNRAEFIKIVLSLQPDDGSMAFVLGCFPDVSEGAWYEVPVCRAKAAGIVRGDALPGQPAGAWPFAPERNVNFAEAVKILVELFGLPVRAQGTGEEWYVRYFEAAMPVLGADAYFDLLNEDITSQENAAWFVTRWEMARLAVDFVAWSEDTLEEYWAAEDGAPVQASSSMPSSSAPPASSSSEDSAPPVSSSSSVSSYSYDSDADVSSVSRILILGATTPVLAAAKVFSDAEPLVINTIKITLDTAVSSIDSLAVYDESARYLGRAYLSGGAVYRLDLKNSDIVVPKREEYSFYVRALLKSHTQGGVSGESFSVSSVTVEGDGDWSNRPYTKSSTDTFPEFQIARSVIDRIENAGSMEEPLVAGEDLVIGSYRFTGRKGDGSADLAVTDLEFKLVLIGGVTVSSPEISVQGVSTRHACSVSSSTVTCASIPEFLGSFEDAPLTIDLHADVSVPADALKAALGANINQPGSLSSAGAVAWTDGTTSFTWVPFSAPVVRGTYYEQ